MSDILASSPIGGEPQEVESLAGHELARNEPASNNELATNDTVDEAVSDLPEPAARHWLLMLAGWVPSIVVVIGLGALAWYGHHHDWRLSVGVPASSAASNIGPAWCDSHGVPEAECINCLSGLIEDAPNLDFCSQHGVHGCVLHDPSLAQTLQPVWATEADFQRAQRALAVRPRRENLSLSQLPGTRIQFASTDALLKAGVDVELVERRPIVESIRSAGEIRYDATKTAQVSPPVDGIVRQVNVNVGDWVAAGQLLALFDSEKVGRMKSELLSALSAEKLKQSTVNRVEPLVRSNTIPGKRLLESQTDLDQASVLVEQAARALENLGISFDLEHLRALEIEQTKSAVRTLGQGEMADQAMSDNWIALTAPLEGRIVRREAVIGEIFDRGSEMFRISDTRKVWLDLRVPAEEASLAQIGQEARYRPDGQRVEHRGEVIWISSEVDPTTRTVRVRAELANENGSLRNESFGMGEIVLRDENDAIVVPESSVQWDGENSLVFVRDARFFEKDRPKFFIARSVRLGVANDGFVEIIAGVLPGEVVASRGSDVLRAQLLKSNLGAGCTCGK